MGSGNQVQPTRTTTVLGGMFVIDPITLPAEISAIAHQKNLLSAILYNPAESTFQGSELRGVVTKSLGRIYPWYLLQLGAD
jgi:hypothetical protein